MKETFEQMALRIKEETYPDWNVNIDRWALEFATRIYNELCKWQEPVAWLDLTENHPVERFTGEQVQGSKEGSAGYWLKQRLVPLYTHPAPIPTVYQCPRCATSMEVDPTAKPAVKSITSDMVTVPREPTAVVLRAMNDAYEDTTKWTWREVYKAMIAAYEKENK